MPTLVELLGGPGLGDANKQFTGDADVEAEVVRGLLESLEGRHTFAIGDLVEWKAGLRNKRWPQIDQPCVVIDVLAEPIRDHTAETGSQYFREPLDLLIGYRHPSDGEFCVYHVDSRRFRPWRGAAS